METNDSTALLHALYIPTNGYTGCSERMAGGKLFIFHSSAGGRIFLFFRPSLDHPVYPASIIHHILQESTMFLLLSHWCYKYNEDQKKRGASISIKICKRKHFKREYINVNRAACHFLLLLFLLSSHYILLKHNETVYSIFV